MLLLEKDSMPGTGLQSEAQGGHRDGRQGELGCWTRRITTKRMDCQGVGSPAARGLQKEALPVKGA